MKKIVMIVGILLSLGFVCQAQGTESNTESIENLTLELSNNATLTQADLIKFEQKINEIKNVIVDFQSRLLFVESTSTNNQESFKSNLSDFKKHIEKITSELSDIKEKNIDHDILIEKLHEVDQNSFNQISDNITQLSSVKSDLSDFKNSNTKNVEQLTAIDQLFSEYLKASDTKIESNNQRVSQNTDSINLIELKLNALTKDINNDFSVVHDVISKRTIYWGLIMGGLALILIFIFVFLKNKLVSSTHSVFEEIGKTRENIDNEYVKLDIKLVELLEKQITMQKQTEEHKTDTEKEIDHSLPLKVAAEIHRMRKRIENMQEDTKGIKPLGKALERLEEELGQKDYKIVDLLGAKYVEGMTVNPRFIPDDSLATGEQNITKVIMPQVNYNGKLIQVADVEVSIGGE